MSAQLCVSKVLTVISSNMYQMSLSRVRPLIPLPAHTLRPYSPSPSQHSWNMPHQSKGQFMGLMLQRVQTGLWDRMFGWYLALLKQASHQNMITGAEREESSCLTSVHSHHINVHSVLLLYLFPYVPKTGTWWQQDGQMFDNYNDVIRQKLTRTSLNVLIYSQSFKIKNVMYVC